MFRSFLFGLICIGYVLATPLDIRELVGKALKNSDVEEPLPAPALPTDKASYSFAVDFSASASVSTLQCIKQNGYAAAFIRVYMPANGGQVDTIGCASVINSHQAGLGTEIYVTPAPTGTKTGSQQFDEFYTYMQNSGIQVSAVWLQVTSPLNWSSYQQTNVNFISSFSQRAKQYGVTPNIYTNWYDWQQITSSWTGWQSIANSKLWYWWTLGQGVNDETPADFSDFRPFGGWNNPAVKQYAQFESLCGLTVNRDVYPSGTKNNFVVDPQRIVVGNVF